MFPTIILLGTLSLGNVLNAGFDQVFNLYNPLVYETGDIIDTFVYRMGLINMQYSFATAIGLMKSVISFVLIVISYRLASRYAGTRFSRRVSMIQSKTLGSRLSRLMIMLALVLITFVSLAPSSIRLWCPSARRL